MSLSDVESNTDYKSNLPGFVLPTPYILGEKDSKKSKNEIIQAMESKLKDMKKNKYRTTNFAIILYFIEKNREKILLSELIKKIKYDFEIEDKIFISSKTKKPFKSTKNLVSSIVGSISRNKSFHKEKKDKEIYLSIIYENALKYLEKMYKKYISDSADVTSISSEKSDDRFFCQSDKDYSFMKILGNKTQRKKPKKRRRQLEISFDSSFDSETYEKNTSEVKDLKENLRSKPSNDINLIINDENDSVEIETNIFLEDFPFFKNKSSTKFVSNSKEEIECLINNVTETKMILDWYINNLEAIKDKIEEREKKLLKYEENKANVRNLKNELNKLYEILELKLTLIQETKKNKFLEDTFEKNKINAFIYKNISFTKIEALKKSLNEMESLEKEITTMNMDITNDIKNMKKSEVEKKYFGKKELKKEYDNLSQVIKTENQTIEYCNGYEFGNVYDDCNKIVKDIIEKFQYLVDQINED